MSIFVLNLFKDIIIKAKLTINIPIIPNKEIASYKKIKDNIVTNTGAHPLATG